MFSVYSVGRPFLARVKEMSGRLVNRLEETEDPWLIKYRPEW